MYNYDQNDYRVESYVEDKLYLEENIKILSREVSELSFKLNEIHRDLEESNVKLNQYIEMYNKYKFYIDFLSIDTEKIEMFKNEKLTLNEYTQILPNLSQFLTSHNNIIISHENNLDIPHDNIFTSNSVVENETCIITEPYVSNIIGNNDIPDQKTQKKKKRRKKKKKSRSNKN